MCQDFQYLACSLHRLKVRKLFLFYLSNNSFSTAPSCFPAPSGTLLGISLFSRLGIYEGTCPPRPVICR
uniref:Nudix hydrolase 7-like n=1 Tax=Rhizophora mucronata TaxID=61149 RepID=A0A2P2LKT6_RHIMU